MENNASNRKVKNEYVELCNSNINLHKLLEISKRIDEEIKEYHLKNDGGKANNNEQKKI